VLAIEGTSIRTLRALAKAVGAPSIATETGISIIRIQTFSNWASPDPLILIAKNIIYLIEYHNIRISFFMNNKSVENLVKASFKDENDMVFFKKSFSLDTTILEILQISNLNPWIKLEFIDVELLEYVEFFGTEPDKIDIAFHFNIDKLCPTDDPEEKKWINIVDQLNSKLWANENIIMETFEVDEIAVLWGGPFEHKVKSNFEVCYYVDYDISWIWFKESIMLKNINDNLKLSLLDFRIKKMDTLVKKIIEEILKEN
jgi:hypothetical protein